MKRGERGPSLITMIYIAVMGVLIAQDIFLKREVVIESLFMYFILTTIPYIIFSRKFKYILMFISISFTVVIIGSLPVAIYQVTGEEPGFIISSVLLGTFSTLLMGTFITKGHWSIKSPWAANIIGSTALFFTEYFLFIEAKIDSQIIIGGIGLLAYLIVSLSYLTLGPSVKMNEPSAIKDESLSEDFIKHIVSNGSYSSIGFKGNSSRHDTVLDRKSQYRDSFRFTFTSTPLSKSKDIKGNKAFQFYLDGKGKRAYPWLAREVIKSMEIHKTKEVKTENVVLVVFDDQAKEPRYSTFEVPLPRSSRTVYVGQITVPNKLNAETIRTLDKLAVELSIKNNESL